MPASEDSRYTNSFDVFMRGQEIISKAKLNRINVESINYYMESFKFGILPHGGFGVGLKRVVMLYCALGNIRRTSMFPRDFKRLTP